MSQRAQKPIYLLADSKPLFWVDNKRRFVATIRDLLERDAPKAAYIGASNGDRAIFYSIFQAAMGHASVSDCRLIPSVPSRDDLDFLLTADIVLLSGGDAWLGWSVMTKNGLSEKLVDCFNSGALMIGVSAGAVQLGRIGWREDVDLTLRSFPRLALYRILLAPTMKVRSGKG